jgi:hypothetical protein
MIAGDRREIRHSVVFVTRWLITLLIGAYVSETRTWTRRGRVEPDLHFLSRVASLLPTTPNSLTFSPTLLYTAPSWTGFSCAMRPHRTVSVPLRSSWIQVSVLADCLAVGSI